MLINPQTAIDNGWIKGITNPDKQVQPNAIDFTLDDVQQFEPNQLAYVGELSKNMRKLRELSPFLPLATDGMEFWELAGGLVYDGMSNIYVEIPDGVAAMLFTRSTFARNGVFITSGLYDSGFKGHIGFTIYTIGGPIDIDKGTRIGQIAFISADAAKMYAGGWNHEDGTHWNSSPLDH